MKIITSYKADILGQLSPGGSYTHVDGSLMKATADTCLSALRFCVDTFLAEWEDLSALTGTFRKKRGEDLIHSTKTVTARYPDFDALFPCMPSGMRRAVVSDALGMVSSWISNHRNWETADPAIRGEEPRMGFPERYELTFYFQEKDVSGLDDGTVRLKLFDGKSWGWHTFRLRPSDARYIARVSAHRRMLSPSIEKVRGKYRIRFAFEERRDLVQDRDPLQYRILACDLGINSAASWCVMEKGSTVHARGIIRVPAEEGRLSRLINRTRMYRRAGKKAKGIYRQVRAANRALSIETARAIIQKAEAYDVDCIVFEHLDLTGRKKRGRLAARLHHWRAKDVQARVETKAHRNGMRISRVCA